MSEFTHYRCGGTLRPIEDPPWYSSYKDGSGPRLFVRCDRCHLEGEVGPIPETQHGN